MTQETGGTSCGFVAVIGAPNAGKSTLINTLVGSKVTIVSPTVQTTRTIVRGIAIHEQSQIVFIDTPGLFSPGRRIERAMVAAAWNAQDEADIILLVCDVSSKKIVRETEKIIARLHELQKDSRKKQSCILILNKVDKIAPPELLPLTQKLNGQFDFTATFMISAEKARGTADLLRYLAKNIPAGPWHYPEDQLSDMPMRLLAAEVTREKLFLRLYHELPHDLTVETEEWEQREDGSAMVHQAIIVTRESQKGIVVGKGGTFIKEVGEEARRELESIIGARIHLKLFVKVQDNWSDDPELYRTWGLDFQS